MSAPCVSADWWQQTSILSSRVAERALQAGRVMSFQVGDCCLQVFASYEPLLEELDSIYGDCTVASVSPGAKPVSCTIGRIDGTSLLSISFKGPNLPDPMEIVQRLFSVLRHRQCYVERPGPVPGLRLLHNAQNNNRLLAACAGTSLLIDLEEAPPEFILDCIMGMVQAAQPGVLFFHAASVGVHGLGALLIGAGRRGKSTTVLAMARRGNAFLGDDITAVRLDSGEILPFPKSAGLRAGPFANQIADRLRSCRLKDATGLDGTPRQLVRVSDLFPDSLSGPLPLRFAFFLDGFGERASTACFDPKLQDVERLRSVVSESTPFWGASPGRDLMRFLTVLGVLKRLRCFSLKLGTPEGSAIAIEEVMAA